MMNKKVTRKQLLLGELSIIGFFAVSKVPSVVKSLAIKKEGNVYGNYSYGGKKNA